jgi:hypothetical protein
MLVLEAGKADGFAGHSEVPGQHIDGIEGREALLLHAQIDVLPLTTGLVGGHFIDEKVLGTLLDDAAQARNVVGEVAARLNVG